MPSPCPGVCKFKFRGHCNGCGMKKKQKKSFKRLDGSDDAAGLVPVAARRDAMAAREPAKRFDLPEAHGIASRLGPARPPDGTSGQAYDVRCGRTQGRPRSCKHWRGFAWRRACSRSLRRACPLAAVSDRLSCRPPDRSRRLSGTGALLDETLESSREGLASG